jgi:hypothetical protein
VGIDETIQKIAKLEAQRDAVSARLSGSARILTHFATAGSGGLKRSPASTRAATAGSAFAMFALSQGSNDRVFVDKAIMAPLANFLRSDVGDMVGPISAPDVTELDPASAKRNSYYVPIWLTGILSGLTDLDEAQERADWPAYDNVKQGIASVAEHFIEQGFLKRVMQGKRDGGPSAYLTYWGVKALIAAQAIRSVDQELKVRAQLAVVDSVLRWTDTEVARQISYHHAGLLQRFDVAECITAACTVLSIINEYPEKHSDDLVETSLHALSLALDHYFQNGSFRLSRPVFADRNQYTVLCSTAELLMILLSSVSSFNRLRLLDDARLEKICKASEWSERNKRPEGYPPDYDSSLSGEPEVSIFSTTSVISLNNLLHLHLDDAINFECRTALGIPQTYSASSARPISNERLRSAVEHKIVIPIRDMRRDDAKYSLILHGPPGTAKTTIAKSISSDLEWPLKVITQSEFLKNGQDKVDSEAEKIFRICLGLKDVVILFDELEELILNRQPTGISGKKTDGEHVIAPERGSRMVTTSMLPRIHELRDRMRVVFLFATNRMTEIDNAATRLGRFDLISYVGYPDPAILCGTLKAHIEEKTKAASVELKVVCNTVAQKWIDDDPKSDLYLTFVDMQYCAEELIYKASKGSSETQCRDHFREKIQELNKVNTVINEQYKPVAKFERL